MESFIHGLGAARSLDLLQILTSLSVSLVLGSVLASVYRWTHVGPSYSRSFVQTVVLASIVSTIMIIAVGNNLARGLGILGALAIIRFRTPIRNPRDIIFLFASLAVGISSGSSLYLVAVTGALFFCLASLILHWSPQSTKRTYSGMLRFSAPMESKVESEVTQIMREFTSNVEMVAIREAGQGSVVEYAYQIRLIDPALKADLIKALKGVGGIGEINLMMQRETVEI